MALPGQTAEDMGLLRKQAGCEHQENRFAFLQEGSNEVHRISSLLFLGYKKFVSSQDAVSCVFHPSCSEYAIQAIQQQGLFIGLLNSFDRLTRCNALSPHQYPVHPGTNLFYDPVKPEDHAH